MGEGLRVRGMRTKLTNMSKKAEIIITVGLDAQQVPETIEWEARDSGMDGPKPTKAIMFNVWDSTEQSLMRIDLWTKEMPVDEMKRFFQQTFASMAETYRRATGQEAGADAIKAFADKFAAISQQN